jgi:hypothetical protein
MASIWCQHCGGEGKLYTSRYGGNDPDVWSTGPCEACNGTGEVSFPDAIKAFPDLTGYAPRAEAWHAYDTSTYCGCPDCHYPVGTGATADEAIADLLEQLAEGIA